MEPLDALLDRIKWDRGFGRGTFALGYYDRVVRREIVVPLASVTTRADAPGSFAFEDEQGTSRTIPFHRVRAVYRDGVAIWRRPAPMTPPARRRGAGT